MKNIHKAALMATFALLIMTGTGVNAAQANESKANQAKELHLFNQATISLSDVIKVAEQKTGGKALEAEVDDEASSVQFEIKTLKNGTINEVMVDGKTGTVVKVSQDDEANEGAEHEKD